MYKYLTEKQSMMILAFPDGQKQEADPFLSPIDFKEPTELINTYCTEVTIVWQNESEAKTQHTKTPQLIQDFELIERSPETEHYFQEVQEKYEEFMDGSNIIQILNLYCAFDEVVLTYPKKDLVVAERIAIKS